jgi:predicted O-methyltransferase YrrM
MIKKHWTLKYLAKRISCSFYEKMNPDKPWLTPDSIKILRSILTKDDIGFEFGSGRSTIWFSNLLGKLTSVEDNKDWYNIVNNNLSKQKISNINYLFCSSQKNGDQLSDYEQVIKALPDESIDFILVDGTHRASISNLSISKLKMGGVYVLDNANWSLRYETNSPSSIGSDGSMDTEWIEFTRQTKNWRMIWTTNGVWDTAILIKK